MNNSAQQVQPTQTTKDLEKIELDSTPDPLGNTKTIIFAVVIASFLLMGGIGGYFLATRNSRTAVSNQPVTPTPTIVLPTPSPTPTPDPKAQWKTYRNEKHGFEIKYPLKGVITDQNVNEARIDLPFNPGTTIFRKYLKIAAGTVPLYKCSNPADLVITESSTDYINGIEFITVSGLRYETGFTIEGFTVSRRVAGQCFTLGFFIDYNNPSPSTLVKHEEGEIFEAILSTLRFDQ